MTGFALFLLSISLLSFEIVLLRIFSIESFHHFAFMAVGVALLGFGASGTILVLMRGLTRGRERGLFLWLLALTPVTLLLAPILAHLPSYDATQLLWDPRQWWSLTAVYGALTLPFLVGAAAIAVALQDVGSSVGSGVGRLYAWNLAGSGVGALSVLPLLALFRPDRALAWTVLPVTVAAVIVLLAQARRVRVAAASLLILLVAVGLLRPASPFRITHFKGLPQVEAFPDARRIGEAWDATGWAVAVDAPAFRHAPGMSLAYPGEIPRQVALFVDGEVAGAMTLSQLPVGAAGLEGATVPPEAEADASTDSVAMAQAADVSPAHFLAWLPTAAPYALGPQATVLVVGSGGGTEVLSALEHGAGRVSALELVEPVTAVARRASSTSENETGRGEDVAQEDPRGASVYDDPRVTLVLGDARSFAARSHERFDLVMIPLAGAFNAAAAGIHSGGEDFLNTVESYRAFLDLLEPGGVLAVSRWTRVPPRDNVRVILMGTEALRRGEQDEVGGRLAFLRSWATGTLLLKPDGFSAEEIGSLRSFARRCSFDVDWPLPTGEPDEARNILAEPVYRNAARAAAAGPDAARRFAEDFPFDVLPATDDRPYFGRFLRLGALPTLLREERGGWLPFAEWGYLAVVATLVQSGLLAVILLGLPVLAFARRKSVTPDEDAGSTLRIGAYFGGIGLGFILVEMAAIQRLTLILGHPVYAAAGTLGVLLIFSGIGSAVSDRFEAARTNRACLAIGGVGLLLALFAPAAGGLMPLTFPLRAAASLILIAIPGTLMGAPFPLGLRKLAKGQGAVAWAWAVNGIASVLGASLAILLAMEVGARGLLVVGAVCYFGTGLVAIGASRESGAERNGPPGRVESGPDVPPAAAGRTNLPHQIDPEDAS